MNKKLITWDNSDSIISFRKKLALSITLLWNYMNRSINRIRKLESSSLTKDDDLKAVTFEEE